VRKRDAELLLVAIGFGAEVGFLVAWLTIR